VLDFGCWTGHFLPSLLKHFPEVWGVDDDSGSVVDTVPNAWTILQVARRLCDLESGMGTRLGLAKATGSALPFSDGYFDVVFCIDTLTHVPESRRLDVIHDLRRVTKSKGQVIFSLPIETGPMRLLRSVARTLTRKRIDADTRTYDFRADLESLRSSFAECKTRFFPVNQLGSFNPFLVVDCRMTTGQSEG
jgi:SAM-dependent methyltransferase